MSQPDSEVEDFIHRASGPVELRIDPSLVPPEGQDQLMDLPRIIKELRGTDSRARGRVTVWRWNPAWYSGTLIIRQFAHGGMLGRLWGTLFLSSRSMRRELHIARHALDSGLQTCRPVALRLEKVVGPLLRAHYVTAEIPNAPNLLEFCRSGAAHKLQAHERQHLAAAVARTLARMHAIGIDHGDLNLKNLLVLRNQQPHEVAVIDFKKARLRSSMDLKAGLQNLLRLDRSVIKWPGSRRQINLTDRLRVLRDYVHIHAQGDVDWKSIARQVTTRHALHALNRL
jgi:hypothetical protein